MFNFKKNRKKFDGSDTELFENVNENNELNFDENKNHRNMFFFDKSSNEEKNMNNKLLSHVSRKKIQSILIEILGGYNQEILDTLHSKSIENNWSETDIYKWAINNKKKITTKKSNFFNSDQGALINKHMASTSNDSSFEKSQSFEKNQFNESYEPNLHEKIDRLNSKIENLEKQLKNSIIEENYRKLLIDNQTEILKNYLVEQFSKNTCFDPRNFKNIDFRRFSNHVNHHTDENSFQLDDYINEKKSFDEIESIEKQEISFDSLLKKDNDTIDKKLNFKISDIINDENKKDYDNEIVNGQILNENTNKLIEENEKLKLSEKINKENIESLKKQNQELIEKISNIENLISSKKANKEQENKQINIDALTPNGDIDNSSIFGYENKSRFAKNDDHEIANNLEDNSLEINLDKLKNIEADEIEIEINNHIEEDKNSNIYEDNLINLENKNYNQKIDNSELEFIKNEREKLLSEKNEFLKEKESFLQESKKRDIESETLKISNLKISDLTNSTVWELDDIINELNQLNIIEDEINDVINLKEKFKKI